MTLRMLRTPASVLTRITRVTMIGCTLLLPAIATAQTDTPTDTTLYDRMLEVSRQELLLSPTSTRLRAEFPVAGYAAMIGKPDGKLSEGTILPSEIDQILNEVPDFCGKQDHREAMIDSRCTQIKGQIRQLIERETAIRTLGRDLLTAASFERPLLVSSFQPESFLTQMQAVTGLWRASHGDDGTRPPIFAQQLSDSDAENLATPFTRLSENLSGLVHTADGQSDDSDFVTAVWRYRYGQLLVDPQSSSRYESIQFNLETIADGLAGVMIAPPLQEGETVFILFPASLQSVLPRNVRVWGYIERGQGENYQRNVGLEWIDPVEPIQPRLCNWTADGACEAVQPTTYPEPIVVPPRLCDHRLGRLGYLCRPVPDTEAAICKDAPQTETNSIVLARCEGVEPMKETYAGPAVCERWAEEKSAMLGGTERCDVTLSCGGLGDGIAAQTSQKRSDGSIEITASDASDLPAKYLFLSQAAHAKRVCAGPTGVSLYDGVSQDDIPGRSDICCRAQTDAYRETCQAMADDGVFDGRGTADHPFTVDTCVQVLTEQTCRNEVLGADRTPIGAREGTNAPLIRTGVCTQFPVAALSDSELGEYQREIFSAANEEAGEQPELIPRSCTEARANPGPRMQALMQSVNDWRSNVCTPGNEVQFRNTIGDAECYLSLCLSQSLREHRLVPAQNAMGVAGAAYPFDACIPPPTDRGSIDTVLAPSFWTPPSYNPSFFLKQVQIGLCAGGAPSILCSADFSQVIGNASPDPTGIGTAGLELFAERRQTSEDFTAMTDALGQRIGNTLYADFLQSRIGLVNGVIREAADLFEKMTRVRFPSVLCPISPEDRAAFVTSQQCSPVTPTE